MADKYVNRAVISVTESGTNTLTFGRLTTGISTFSRQAFLIHRVMWYFADRHELVADDDYVQAALSTSNKFTGIGLDDPSVIITREWHSNYSGTPANQWHYQVPDTDDFSTLPGGGILVPANPIFLAVTGSSMTGAVTVTIRIDFTVIELKADEFIELVESLRMIE